MIGTNSAGAVSYGNQIEYNIPNTNITLLLSSATNPLGKELSTNQKELIEGRGYIPDYWCTNEDEYYETVKYLYERYGK